MRLSIALLGFLCCASIAPAAPPPLAPPGCRTPCGMVALEGDCEALVRHEARVVKTLGAIAPYTPEAFCSSLRGWRIRVHPQLAADRDGCNVGWQLVPFFCVRGYTWVDKRVIEINSDGWRSSSLAHEMIHVADTARGIPGGHCWSAEVRAALEDLTGHPDTSTPEADCK